MIRDEKAVAVVRAASIALVLEALSGCVKPLEITEGTATQCDVHHETLREGVVRADTATVDYLPEYYAAREALFPYARTSAHGPYAGYTHTEVLYCPQCRRAKAEWQHDFRRRGNDE
ncbi:MAG: hypothetical protein ACYSXF_03830 [Planctomycetota bacterium]|jgi:hypothetical protein